MLRQLIPRYPQMVLITTIAQREYTANANKKYERRYISS